MYKILKYFFGENDMNILYNLLTSLLLTKRKIIEIIQYRYWAKKRASPPNNICESMRMICQINYN